MEQLSVVSSAWVCKEKESEQAMGGHVLDVSHQRVERNCPPHGSHWVRKRVLETAPPGVFIACQDLCPWYNHVCALDSFRKRPSLESRRIVQQRVADEKDSSKEDPPKPFLTPGSATSSSAVVTHCVWKGDPLTPHPGY